MDSPITSLPVRHNRAASRFEIEVDGRLCVAEYEARGETWVMTHTLVPPELRGRGLAEVVVRAALDEARTEKRRVVPACSYVARFIEKNPSYQSLLGGGEVS